MGRSLEDGALVLLNDFELVADIVGVVCADLRGDAEVGTQESGAQFCDEFLAGIACVAETLAAEVTVETCFMACTCELKGISISCLAPRSLRPKKKGWPHLTVVAFYLVWLVGLWRKPRESANLESICCQP